MLHQSFQLILRKRRYDANAEKVILYFNILLQQNVTQVTKRHKTPPTHQKRQIDFWSDNMNMGGSL